QFGNKYQDFKGIVPKICVCSGGKTTQTWRKWPHSCRLKQLEMDRCEGIDGYTCDQYKEDVLYHKTQ
ncbi:hypothetical protein LDENG_00173510, partial [Lucifuga dentata]